MAGHIATSTQCIDWATPLWLFQRCSEIWGPFDVDVAANKDNHLCDVWYGPDSPYGINALDEDWLGRCWMNPPYNSKSLLQFTAKAHVSARMDFAGTTNAPVVVGLVPAKTDQPWWQENVVNCANEIIFIKGRLKFGGGKWGAPFPSAIVIWHAGFDVG